MIPNAAIMVPNSASSGGGGSVAVLGTLNNILLLTPAAKTIAYATDVGQFLVYDGINWQLDSSYFLPKTKNFDMGAVQNSNLAGYGLTYVTDKLLANIVLGYGGITPVEGTPVEGQLVHDPVNFVTQIFQNGKWFALATGNFRELSPQFVLATKPDSTTQWIDVYSGNSEALGLNGLPLVQGYTASMGAYPVPLVVGGGTF